MLLGFEFDLESMQDELGLLEMQLASVVVVLLDLGFGMAQLLVLVLL